jgi:hypothetical protein
MDLAATAHIDLGSVLSLYVSILDLSRVATVRVARETEVKLPTKDERWGVPYVFSVYMYRERWGVLLTVCRVNLIVK